MVTTNTSYIGTVTSMCSDTMKGVDGKDGLEKKQADLTNAATAKDPTKMFELIEVSNDIDRVYKMSSNLVSLTNGTLKSIVDNMR